MEDSIPNSKVRDRHLIPERCKALPHLAQNSCLPSFYLSLLLSTTKLHVTIIFQVINFAVVHLCLYTFGVTLLIQSPSYWLLGFSYGIILGAGISRWNDPKMYSILRTNEHDCAMTVNEGMTSLELVIRLHRALRINPSEHDVPNPNPTFRIRQSDQTLCCSRHIHPLTPTPLTL